MAKSTDTAPEAAPAGTGKKMKKAEALRQAVDKLGIDATPTNLQKYILETFNIEMSRDHISTAKGEIRRKMKIKGRPGRKPKAAAAPAPAPALVVAASSANGTGSVNVDEILMLMSLVKRVSPRVVHDLVDGMGH
jgi:hypothetical protein